MSKNNDPSVITAAGGCYIRTEDGRVVAYSKDGSTDPNAPIVVNAYIADYHVVSSDESECNSDSRNTLIDYKKIPYTVITISLPGIGHSDLHPGLKVIEWPTSDLLPILEKEGVGRFHLCGFSLGTLYATATAQVLGERVLSLGLRVPYLPLPLSEELQLPRKQPTLPKTEAIEQNTFSVRFIQTTLGAAIGFYGSPSNLSLWCMKMGLLGAAQKSIARFHEEYKKEAKYLSILAANWPPLAMMYLVAEDVALDVPGVDHRLVDDKLISVKKRMVWYASDDSDCPPSHGKWLAEEGWKGCGSVRVFDNYNHNGGATIDHNEFLETLIKLGE